MKRSATFARVLAPVFSLSLLAGYVLWSHRAAQVAAADVPAERGHQTSPALSSSPSHVLQLTLAEQLEQGELRSVLTPLAWPSQAELESEKVRLKSRPVPPRRLMSSSKYAQVFAEPVPGTLWHSVVSFMVADDHGGVSDEVSPQKLEQKRMEQRSVTPQSEAARRLLRTVAPPKNVWNPLTDLLLPVHSNNPAQGSGSVLQPAP